MIGQTKLLSKIDSYTIDTFPRSVLLIGERGSGKHLICDYIKNKLNLDLIDMTKSISNEYIENIYRNVNPTIYMIDTAKILDTQQNALLKLIEEPLKNSFLIILAETDFSILNTVNNRCFKLVLDRYSDEELLQLTQDKNISADYFKAVRTPGDINLCDIKMFNDMSELIDKMITKMNVASYANTLSIVNKFNYSDEYHKFDLNIFLNLFSYRLFDDFTKNNNFKSFKMYNILINESKKLHDYRINRQVFVEHLLTVLWKASRDDK